MERFPSFASNPRAIWSLNFSQASFKNSLFFIAPLPKITFSTPASIYCLMLSSDLTPPPISTFKSYLLTICLITSRLTVFPVKAPSKSTICKFLKP